MFYCVVCACVHMIEREREICSFVRLIDRLFVCYSLDVFVMCVMFVEQPSKVASLPLLLSFLCTERTIYLSS
jgi:hypothetical protein